MNRKSLDSQQKGVGGFFVDLPILILVLAVTAVLITSIYQLYVPVQEEKEKMELNDRCIQLKNEIQNYDKIQAEGQTGEFSIEKLQKVNRSKIKSYLDPGRDYDYSIFFEDIEGEFERSFGSDLPAENDGTTVSTYTAPVSLVNQEEVSRIGGLEVKVWIE